MDKEQLLEQFDELHKKYSEFSDRQLSRSAMKAAIEAKRFAKSHRLLMPYLAACFSITNSAQAISESEIGIDNAMEIIALVESEEKARKFQHDFDEDHYQYTVHWISACAYDNLAKHTAMCNGYNSPVIHGAVDDGIHVCRRTGKLECVECFREYAFDICLASGDYEMGEHHARLNATSMARQGVYDRRWVGYNNLTVIYRLMGKLGAAFNTDIDENGKKLVALVSQIKFERNAKDISVTLNYDTPEVEGAIKIFLAAMVEGVEKGNFNFKADTEP